MTWSLTESEFNAVSLLPEPRRYLYFVHKVADEEQLWGLWRDGWAFLGDDDGRELAPFWPHAMYAKVCATGLWQDFAPRSIVLSVFQERWVSGLANDKRLVAVFPTPSDRAVVVEPIRLATDLNEELAKYRE